MKIETTVIGSARDLTMLREAIKGDVIPSGFWNGGADITDVVAGAVIGVTLEGAATYTRRGVWSVQRRRRGPVQELVSD